MKWAPFLLVLSCATPSPPFDGAGAEAERRLFLEAPWDDGHAEVATYRVLEERYGVLREGEATLIVVTEALDADTLVKADGPRAPARTLDVVKLNHVLSLQTGVYTYRQMASVFLTRDRARLVKAVVGSQEWCGITHKRLLVREGRATLHGSSYFGAEGERSYDVPMDARTLLYDALPVWLRTLDLSRPGERSVMLVARQLSNRVLRPDVAPATITVGGAREVDVPAGGRRAVPVTVAHADGTDVFSFDAEAPHTLLLWERSDGARYELRRVVRARYWELNGPDDVGALDAPAVAP